MEAIETRSESPSSKTRSSSRLSNVSNQENSNDSDGKDFVAKRKIISSTRKGKINDKEKEEIDIEANGDASANETLLSGTHSIEETETKAVNLKNGSECEKLNITENGNKNNVSFENSVVSEESHNASNNKIDGITENAAEGIEVESKDEEQSFGDEVLIDDTPSQTSKIVLADAETHEIIQNNTKNNNMVTDTEESCFTMETTNISMERADNNQIISKDLSVTEDQENLESKSDLFHHENENDIEYQIDDVTIQTENNQNLIKHGDESSDQQNIENLQNNQTLSKSLGESKKGFFGKWNFRLAIDKKESETNGHSSPEEINRANLYYSSIKGRLPLKASPYLMHGENSKSSNLFYKTPSNSRNLDDSFGVKSEPSRSNRGEVKDKSNLRKFPAKRCLNTDESDDKDESFLSGLNFPKRRKLDECESRRGFLRNFLWSPFRKRNSCDRMEEDMEESNSKNQMSKSSWFRSPFWFWKRCNKEESN